MTNRLKLLFNSNTLLEAVLSYIENQYGLKVNELNTDEILSIISKSDFLSMPDEDVFTKLDSQIDKIILNNESYFFRFPLQLEVIKRIFNSKDKLNILSFGSSSGEEAYSVVMFLNELPLSLDVYGVDIDSGMVESAKKGIYTKNSLRQMPEEFMKFFERDSGDRYIISYEIRNSVTFLHLNILKEDIEQKFSKGFFDIILINNVMIYMTDQMIQHTIKNLSNLLKNDGLLFTSEEESVIKHLNTFFGDVNEPGIKYFRKQSFYYLPEIEFRELYDIEFNNEFARNIDYKALSSYVGSATYEEGLSAFESEDFLKSIGILYRLIKEDPTNDKFLALIAKGCYKGGFATEAKKWLKMFLILKFDDEKQIDVYLGLCIFTKDYSEYIEMLRKKIKFFKNPNDIEKLKNIYDEMGLN